MFFSLVLISLFFWIQHALTDQYYLNSKENEKEIEIWREECGNVCESGWIKVCEIRCLRKQRSEKCKKCSRKDPWDGALQVCTGCPAGLEDLCKYECFYKWHHKKPHLNLPAKKSAKMDNSQTLETLKIGMESLVKVSDINRDGNVTRHELEKLTSLLEKDSGCTNLQSCAMVGWKKMCMEEGNCTTKGGTDCEKKSSRKVCAKLKVDTHKWYANAVPTEVCAELSEWGIRVCTEGGLVGKCAEMYSLDACAKACTNMGGTKEVCTQMCACTNPQEGLQALGDALETINAVLNAFGLSKGEE